MLGWSEVDINMIFNETVTKRTLRQRFGIAFTGFTCQHQLRSR
jgi:hypothetical protein